MSHSARGRRPRLLVVLFITHPHLVHRPITSRAYTPDTPLTSAAPAQHAPALNDDASTTLLGGVAKNDLRIRGGEREGGKRNDEHWNVRRCVDGSVGCRMVGTRTRSDRPCAHLSTLLASKMYYPPSGKTRRADSGTPTPPLVERFAIDQAAARGL